MPMQQLINSIAYGWSEIVVSLDGVNFNTFKAISYKDTIERGKLRGTSMRVLGKTSGQHDSEASIEMGFAEWKIFQKQLGDAFMKQRFHVTVSYSDDDGTGDNPAPQVHSDWFDAKIKDHENSHSSGTEPLTVKLSLDVIGPIYYDGIDPLGTGRP